jgi:hypothetical protein
MIGYGLGNRYARPQHRLTAHQLQELQVRFPGATSARAHFSGGNDEGGVEHIGVRNAGGELLGEITMHYKETWGMADGKFGLIRYTLTPEQERESAIYEVMAGPINDEYGSFAGEFSVQGHVDWDLTLGTHSKLSDRYEDFEDDYSDEEDG